MRPDRGASSSEVPLAGVDCHTVQPAGAPFPQVHWCGAAVQAFIVALVAGKRCRGRLAA
jgi:hypothetical protein